MSGRAWSLEEMALVVEALPHPACVLREGALILANPSLTALLGGPLEALGANPFPLAGAPTPADGSASAVLPLELEGQEPLDVRLTGALRRAADGGADFRLVSLVVLGPRSHRRELALALEASERRNTELSAVAELARLAAMPSPPPLEILLECLRLALRAGLVRLTPAAGGAPLEVGSPGWRGGARLSVDLELGEGPGWRLEVERAADEDFGEDEGRLSQTLVDLLRSALGQRRLREEGARQLDETRLLLELARTTSGTLDTESILDVACEFLARLLDVSSVLVYLYDGRTGVLSGATASAPHREQVRETSLTLDEPGITTEAAREGRAVSLEDASRARERLHPDLYRRFGGCSLLALPMVSRDELMGVVTLVDDRAPRRFSPQQLELAEATVGQLALSIANARLYESLWRSYADLAAARAEMVKRERLAALGELSAIVAHEVRNPLGVIFNAISSLRRAGLAEGDAGMLVDILAEESDRLNRIVGDLLDFSRPRELDLEPLEVPALLEEALEVARAAAIEASRNVTFEVELGPGLGRVSVDRRLFRQALVNVLLNALQAMGRGGKVTLRARAESSARATGLLLEVIDRGAGIASELRARIFEPFFTTKARGTGLGLAVVKRIVDDHRGEVFLESKLGVGTTFSFRLPWVPGGAPEPTANQDA